MAGLRKTDIFAKVVWLGHVQAGGGSLRATPRDRLELIFGGVKGTQHFGLQRASCGRVRELYPRGTGIMNTRQL